MNANSFTYLARDTQKFGLFLDLREVAPDFAVAIVAAAKAHDIKPLEGECTVAVAGMGADDKTYDLEAIGKTFLEGIT